MVISLRYSSAILLAIPVMISLALPMGFFSALGYLEIHSAISLGILSVSPIKNQFENSQIPKEIPK